MRSSTTAAATSLLSAALVACAPGPNIGGGGEGSIDEALLDRSADGGPCGYPGGGYGADVGDRLANSLGFEIIDCAGEPVQLADFMCKREDSYGDFNRGVLVNIGAGWCAPCQEETLEFPELYEEYHDQGIEFVQIMFQDWGNQAPTKGFCTDWSTGQWVGADGTNDVGINLEFPVLLDRVNDWTFQYLSDPAAATPINMLLDANANIRWKTLGQKPELSTLRTQFDLVIAEPYAPPS